VHAPYRHAGKWLTDNGPVGTWFGCPAGLVVATAALQPRNLRMRNGSDTRKVRTAGTFFPWGDFAFGLPGERHLRERNMHGLIYLIGLIVVILFILSLLGLR
jgi:hypothetical protein